MQSSNGRRRVLVIAGDIGAGKSTSARYLASTYGAAHLSFVDLIWTPILATRSLPSTRENLQLLGLELMREVGPEGLADEMLRMCSETTWAVIDDVRSPSVYERFRFTADECRLLYLDAPFESRYPRVVVRDGVRSESEQRMAEEYPTETEIGDLRRQADWVVSNDADQDVLWGRLDGIASQIGLSRALDD